MVRSPRPTLWARPLTAAGPVRPVPNTRKEPTPSLRPFSPAEMPYVPSKISSSSKACLSGPFSRKSVRVRPAGPGHLLSTAGLSLLLGCRPRRCPAALTHRCLLRAGLLLLLSLAGAGAQGAASLVAPSGQGWLGWPCALGMKGGWGNTNQ